MIAKNMLKFAEALALQMPLRFGPLRQLKQARPTTRAGRAARSARAAIRRAALKLRVIYPMPKPKSTAKRDTRISMQWPLPFTAIALELF
ncbi:MAG: hypothetical protein IIA02_12575 [Proteobacteria bacterium]|nr:hypothetical protein [Pseudomonadota bacterium]